MNDFINICSRVVIAFFVSAFVLAIIMMIARKGFKPKGFFMWTFILVIALLYTMSITAVIYNNGLKDKAALAAANSYGKYARVGRPDSSSIRIVDWRDGSHPQAIWYKGELYFMKAPPRPAP